MIPANTLLQSKQLNIMESQTKPFADGLNKEDSPLLRLKVVIEDFNSKTARQRTHITDRTSSTQGSLPKSKSKTSKGKSKI